MIRGILFDLDGTVYHGTAEVPGAADFVRQLPGWGIRPVFITNRANRTPEAVAEHLRSYGIACTTDDVLTSAQTTAQVLPKGSVYIIGEEGIRRALADAGFVEDDRHPDYVVVSYDRSFNYKALMQACRLVKAGARFVATNPDKYLTLEDGITARGVRAVGEQLRQTRQHQGKLRDERGQARDALKGLINQMLQELGRF